MKEIPIYGKTPGSTPPDSDFYYMLARNGAFFRLKTDWIDAIVPATELHALEPQIPQGKLLLPPIDAVMFWKIVHFFHRVFLRHQTEACVLLHYEKTLGWAFTVPPQQVNASIAKYDMIERLPGYRCVGTMHSHGNLDAYHSDTDVPDEAEFDGVHVTIGNVHLFPRFTMDAEVLVRETRFKLPVSTFEGVIPPPPLPADRQAAYTTRKHRGTIYSLAPQPELNRDWIVPREWMNRLRIIPLPIERLNPQWQAPWNKSVLEIPGQENMTPMDNARSKRTRRRVKDEG